MTGSSTPMRSGHFDGVRGRCEINASIRRPGEIRFWLEVFRRTEIPAISGRNRELSAKSILSPMKQLIRVRHFAALSPTITDRPSLDEAQRWRSRGGLDRCRGEIVEVGAPWRARSGISPVYAGRIVDQARSRVARGFRRRRPRSERPRARRPDGTGRSLRSVTRLGGLTRPFLIQWMRPATTLARIRT